MTTPYLPLYKRRSLVLCSTEADITTRLQAHGGFLPVGVTLCGFALCSPIYVLGCKTSTPVTARVNAHGDCLRAQEDT